MRFRRVSGLAAAALVASLVGSPGAMAGTASTTFAVTATVLASCTVAASTLAFGSYTATAGSPTDTTSTVNVTCTNGTTYNVALDGGSTANNVSARAMSDGASHTLSYQMYTGATHATIWGDGTGSTVTLSGSGTGSQQSFTVYGRVPAAQFAAAGSYSDTVTVSVSY